MSVEHLRRRCQNYVGRCVEIRTHDGNVHRGIVHGVGRDEVFIRPLGHRRGFGGYSFGFGFGRRGFVTGFAFGAIATLALVPFFWW